MKSSRTPRKYLSDSKRQKLRIMRNSPSCICAFFPHLNIYFMIEVIVLCQKLKNKTHQTNNVAHGPLYANEVIS